MVRTWAFSCQAPGLEPGWEIKIPKVVRHGQNKMIDLLHKSFLSTCHVLGPPEACFLGGRERNGFNES